MSYKYNAIEGKFDIAGGGGGLSEAQADTLYLRLDTTNDPLTGNLDMGDNAIEDVGYMDFNLINGIAQAEGRLVWNDDEGTLNLGMKGGVVNLQVGMENVFRAKNVSGGAISDGNPVRVSGGVSDQPEVNLADANDPAADNACGVATEDIGSNQFGYVTTFGLVRDINTTGTPVGETWSVGEDVYVSNTAGALTNVIPTSTERIIKIGKVVRAHASEGVLWICPSNVPFLSDLSGNTISSPADNELLAYDSGTGLWINQTPTEAGLDSIYLKLDASNDPVTGALAINNSLSIQNQNELRFYEGANYVGFEAPALAADQIWVLPVVDGAAGEFWQTDGAGNLSFAAVTPTSPGGSDTQVQFNDGGSFGGDSRITYNKTINQFKITGSSSGTGKDDAILQLDADWSSNHYMMFSIRENLDELFWVDEDGDVYVKNEVRCAFLRSTLMISLGSNSTITVQNSRFTSADKSMLSLAIGDMEQSSGTMNTGVEISPDYEQTGTANGTDLWINRSVVTGEGSGEQLYLAAGSDDVIKFKVDNQGTLKTLTGGRVVNTTRITANTTLDATHHNVFCDTDGGAITVTLPAGADGTYHRIINTGSSNLSITPDGAELLLGVNSSWTLSPGEVLIIVYETTEGWY